jgi:surface protein
MWKPIQSPGEWLVFLQRKDIKGLPIMEARKRYMQEQLLFENYYSNLQTLNTVNTVSPSVASAAAVGGGGGPKRSIGPSGARGREALPLLMDFELALGKTTSTRNYYVDSNSSSPTIQGFRYPIKKEIFPSSSIVRYEWKYPYAEVGTNHPYGWNTPSVGEDVSNITSSLIPPPNIWSDSGVPDLGEDWRHLYTKADIFYEYFVSGTILNNLTSYTNQPLSETRGVSPFKIYPWNSREIVYITGSSGPRESIITFNSPFRIEWGDGTQDTYQAGEYRWTEAFNPPNSVNLSDSWSLDNLSPLEEEGLIQGHGYELDFLVPKEWISSIPDPIANPIDLDGTLATSTRGNSYSKIGIEAPATSSDGNFPWGGPWNNWWDFTDPVNIKVYSDGGAIRIPRQASKINYLNISNRTSLSGLFQYLQYVDITPLNISEWDTSNITNMSYIFDESSFTLGSSSLANWDTSNVTRLDGAFRNLVGDSNLINPGDIGQWDVSSCENFSGIFATSIFWAELNGSMLSSDLSNWGMNNATNMDSMFYSNGALQHNTNFNNWNVSGSSLAFIFYGTSFNQPLTNWVPAGDARSWASFTAMSHTNYWATLEAWASSSAENVNMSNSYYKMTLGYTPSRTYSKPVCSISGEAIRSWGLPHTPDDDSAINYADYYKWFNTWTRLTDITCISGSNNHKTYQKLIEKGWTVGQIDVLDTGSISENRVTQLPVHVTVDSGEYVMTSSYWTPVSEIQSYDNYDHLYTPTLTYRFDQSDSSNTGHPLKFSETLDGTHGGGTEYTLDVTSVGTPGTSGSYTDVVVSKLNGFEVEHKPKLYAYCENHSGMSEFYLETYI